MGVTNYPDGVDGSHAYFNEPETVETEIIDEQADAEKIKQLALAQALFKSVKELVATGDEFNLRGEVDAIMAERFEQAKKIGLTPKSFDIEIDGEKVGTYSITTTKAKPQEEHVELRIENNAEYTKWAVEHDCVTVDHKKVDRLFELTGEVPDGCVAEIVTTPADKGGRISKTTLRIDPQKVEYSLGADLQGMTAWLLGSGDE
ncbi:MAG: hypothetical protein IKE23_11025 [Exiguobacterium sp.]|nr:hypothetical protein [Exiguobacterium sp.]